MLNVIKNVNRLSASSSALSKTLLAKNPVQLSVASVSSGGQRSTGPISFAYTDDQKELIEGARKFVKDVVIPNAAKWDRMF